MAYNNAEYENALAFFETAMSYFNKTENMSYVMECENWIVLTRLRIDEEIKAMYIRYAVVLLGIIAVLLILLKKRDSLRTIYSNTRTYITSVKLPKISLTFQNTQTNKPILSEEGYRKETEQVDKTRLEKTRKTAVPSSEIDREMIKKMVQEEMIHETIREEMEILKKEIIKAVREELSKEKKR